MPNAAPVNWRQVAKSCTCPGVRHWIELGTGKYIRTG